MCQYGQVVASVCFPLPHVEQVFVKKHKIVALALSIQEDEDVTTIANEDTTPLPRKKQR